MDTTPVYTKRGKPGPQTNERLLYSMMGDHPRIVKCLNTNLYDLPAETRIETAKTEPIRLALAPNGDLAEYMANHGDIPQLVRAKWGLQIAEGIAFLHSRSIVWGDCSPNNILLTADLDALLCDFAGSTLPGAPTNGCAPPYRYTNPDVDFAFNFSANRKIDTFAFGCVFLEILTWSPEAAEEAWCPQVTRGGPDYYHQGLLIDTVAFAPFKEIVENCWDDKYESGEELFAAVREVWEKFQESEGNAAL
ncbi:kinase-like domain-containing protein [Mycena filopes]|nr:kinase-like domain-containing protein [Mycena filopes]